MLVKKGAEAPKTVSEVPRLALPRSSCQDGGERWFKLGFIADAPSRLGFPEDQERLLWNGLF